MKQSLWRETTLAALFLLTFLQLLTDFVETTYSFALCSIGLTTEVCALALLLAPGMLLLFRDGPPSHLLHLAGGIMLLCRLLEPAMDARSRLALAGIGTAASMILLPALLWNARRKAPAETAWIMGAGLILAVAVSILLRALNSGLDMSIHGPDMLGWALVGGAVCLSGLLHARPGNDPSGGPWNLVQTRQAWRCVSGGIGMTGVLVLVYLGFMSPQVIARWTGAHSALATAWLGLGLLASTAVLTWPGVRAVCLHPKTLFLLNLLFLFSMTATIVRRQTPLPPVPALYPVFAHDTPAPIDLGLLAIMAFTFPVTLLSFSRYGIFTACAAQSFRGFATACLAGAAFLLVMICAHLFTSVYDYVPLVGPLFRDRFWAVYLTAGLAAALPLLLIQPLPCATAQENRPENRTHRRFVLPAAVLLSTAASVAAAYWIAPDPAPPALPVRSLSILSYNIQQGYTEEGQRGYEAQLNLMRDAGADIIGLQECDTNRIAQGNIDLPGYYARRLNMHLYYGPSPVAGTFGLALLSRYPIRNPRTAFLYSHSPRLHESEQTAAIIAEIAAGEKTFHILVTHLGNGGPLEQQKNLLQCAGAAENLILMGDFNSAPGEDAYELAAAHFQDAWLRAGQGNAEGREIPNRHRIDHIFLAHGLAVEESRYLIGTQSDHPALFARIAW